MEMDWVEFTAKSTEEALTAALMQLETTSDNVEYEILEKETNGILGLGLFSKAAKIRVRCKFGIINVARIFLTKIFKSMNMDAKLDISYDESNNVLDINMVGEDMGVLIGKRGKTLDSLQYLTSLVVNKESTSYVKVKIDTENYRARRKETLENLARNIAYKVKRTKSSISIEPMNPYERRIIHSALQNDKYVETHSEGEEPYRRVVVSIKKYNNDYKSNNKAYKNDYKNDYKKEYSKEN